LEVSWLHLIPLLRWPAPRSAGWAGKVAAPSRGFTRFALGERAAQLPRRRIALRASGRRICSSSTSWPSTGSPPGALHVDMAFTLDRLSGALVLVVTGVGFLIHVYSVGYIDEDPGLLALLRLPEPVHRRDVDAESSATTWSRCSSAGKASDLLVSVDRLLVHRRGKSLRGAQGVHRQRIGDFGFLIGIFILYNQTGSVTISQINTAGAAAQYRDGGRRLPLHRRDRQERAASLVRLAARRDGRPDAGLGADPRRHHGHRRRLHGARLSHLYVSAPGIMAAGDRRRAHPRSGPR